MSRTEFEKPVTWKPLNLIALNFPQWLAPRGVGAGTSVAVTPDDVIPDFPLAFQFDGHHAGSPDFHQDE